jgi:hypothetical protein
VRRKIGVGLAAKLQLTRRKRDIFCDCRRRVFKQQVTAILCQRAQLPPLAPSAKDNGDFFYAGR